MDAKPYSEPRCQGCQPLVIDKDGTVRFRQNAIVRFLLDAGPFDMNQLAHMPFSDEDRALFAQLIGYSVSGYGELPYTDPLDVERHDEEVDSIARRFVKEGE